MYAAEHLNGLIGNSLKIVFPPAQVNAVIIRELFLSLTRCTAIGINCADVWSGVAVNVETETSLQPVIS
jgi:hypothetical protein